MRKGPGLPRAFAALAACLASAFLACGSAESKALESIDARVASLTARSDLTASAGGLDAYRVVLDAESRYAAGAELIARAAVGDIARLDLTAFGNLGKLEDSYVFDGEELVWVRKKSYRYSSRSAGISLDALQTWYFSGGRFLRLMDGISGKELGPSAQLRDLAASILEEAGRLKLIARQAIRDSAGE